MSDLAPEGQASSESAPTEPAAPDAAVCPQQPAPAAQAPPAEAPRQAPPEQLELPGEWLVARYGIMKQLGRFRCDIDPPPAVRTRLVVRTERGVELAEVVMPLCREEGPEACRRCITPQRLEEFLTASGPEYPFNRDGRVLRLANPQDVIDQRHLDGSAREEAVFCRQQIRELKLPMKLVTVEHLLGGERIIFYFSSEQRVDFRELVRRLASQYRTRIEMRQVGARDEARLVADYERCGQRCCCQEFLKNLKPVSMRMAKMQKATLDPSKISGRCGRLMCCLRYEDEGYEELRKKLPRKNIWVQTASGVVGRVLEGHILTQLVRLSLPDNTQAVVSNEEIVQRDVPAPSVPQAAERQERPPREQKVKGPPRLLRDLAEEAGERPGEREALAVESQAGDGLEQAGEMPAEPSAEVSQAQQPPAAPTVAQQQPRPQQPGQAQQPPAGQEGRRRRRRRGKRRRKGPPPAQGQQGAPPPQNQPQ